MTMGFVGRIETLTNSDPNSRLPANFSTLYFPKQLLIWKEKIVFDLCWALKG